MTPLDHHAYLVLRTDNDARDMILDHVSREFAMQVIGNPDVVTEYFENFGIDDAKRVTTLQSRKSVGGGKQIIVLQCEQLTLEAQNALLKTFEEPTEDTILFLCVPSESTIIPTLRSRLVMFDGITLSDTTPENIPDARDFIDASPAVRLVHIQDLIDGKNKTCAQEFVNAIITEYDSEAEQYTRERKVLLSAERLLGERGSSIKLVLEHLALTL